MRPACRQPSNLRRPRPKTTRTEPACIVEPQHHPACQLSRPSPINYRHHALFFPLASCRQESAASLTVSAGLGSRDHASFSPTEVPSPRHCSCPPCQLRAEESQGRLGNMIWFIWFIWFDRFSSTGGGRVLCNHAKVCGSYLIRNGRDLAGDPPPSPWLEGWMQSTTSWTRSRWRASESSGLLLFIGCRLPVLSRPTAGAGAYHRLHGCSPRPSSNASPMVKGQQLRKETTRKGVPGLKLLTYNAWPRGLPMCDRRYSVGNS